MEFVVNEWLLDFMRPDANRVDLENTLRFLNAIVRKCDKLVIRRPSPFVAKFYRYMKQFGGDPKFKARFSKLYQLLFVNADKTVIVDDADVQQLPEEIKKAVPLDDEYLVELAYSSPDKTLITTDQKLKDKLQGKSQIKVHLFPEFVKTYLAS